MGHAGGMDLYAYAAGDPTSARDPSGMGAEPEPEDPSAYACLGTIRGCGGGNSNGGGGGGGGVGHFFMVRIRLDVLIPRLPWLTRNP